MEGKYTAWDGRLLQEHKPIKMFVRGEEEGGERGRRVNCSKKQATQGVKGWERGTAVGCKRRGEEKWDGGENNLLRGDQPLAGGGVLGAGK